MNIIVTGGAGFIGSNFVRYWLQKYPEDSIKNIDLLTYAGSLSTTKDFQKKKNYSFLKADICNKEAMEHAANGADLIVHFAAESHVDRSISSPQRFLETNILGTHTMLEAARKNGVSHFHHISTDEVFGSLDLKSKHKFTEVTQYDPRSPYAASKAAADHLVRSYGTTYGLSYTITNCSNNYGPFQHPEKFIPRMITNLIKGDKVLVYGTGRNVRDWLHVEDHITAIEAIIRSKKSSITYLVGGMNEDISNLEVAKLILHLMKKNDSEIEYVADRKGHDLKYAVDWSKLHDDLGWSPQYEFEKRIAETISWYQDNEWWWSPLKKEAESFYKTSSS